MASSPSTNDKTAIEILANNTLPPVFCDNVNVAGRSDGIHLLRFITSLPEGHIEQAKIMMLEDNIKTLINALCDHTKYYPVKPTPAKKAAKAKK